MTGTKRARRRTTPIGPAADPSCPEGATCGYHPGVDRPSGSRRVSGRALALGGVALAIVGVVLIVSPDLFWEEIGLAILVIEVGLLIVVGGVWSLATRLGRANGSIWSLLLLPSMIVRMLIGFGVVLFGLAILVVALFVH